MSSMSNHGQVTLCKRNTSCQKEAFNQKNLSLIKAEFLHLRVFAKRRELACEGLIFGRVFCKFSTFQHCSMLRN